ncbi:hypothetical protein PPL_01725 [Heterostelium album PN500]|uniref:IPT/TIG domain-containing protein n=1 Tax=Heterostelium pallidum (strain ATCC 26659 / Pp 5 / PN500) TaxID=670386 RepID=D3B0A9_HETP5|nr:hypothetical protein PPL_01725 [Heterostelium album PN500]EFA84733.1 hypothetical protein PPL_01725 [Heterostelium album PN500]|eukprot:XP_020436845.1 hypothetical protein PPL_01725 [Heterostelium album PN500]
MITGYNKIGPNGGILTVFGNGFPNDLGNVHIKVGNTQCNDVHLIGSNSVVCTLDSPDSGVDLSQRFDLSVTTVIDEDSKPSKYPFYYDWPIIESVDTTNIYFDQQNIVAINGSNFKENMAVNFEFIEYDNVSIGCNDIILVNYTYLTCQLYIPTYLFQNDTNGDNGQLLFIVTDSLISVNVSNMVVPFNQTLIIQNSSNQNNNNNNFNHNHNNRNHKHKHKNNHKGSNNQNNNNNDDNDSEDNYDSDIDDNNNNNNENRKIQQLYDDDEHDNDHIDSYEHLESFDSYVLRNE